MPEKLVREVHTDPNWGRAMPKEDKTKGMDKRCIGCKCVSFCLWDEERKGWVCSICSYFNPEKLPWNQNSTSQTNNTLRSSSTFESLSRGVVN